MQTAGRDKLQNWFDGDAYSDLLSAANPPSNAKNNLPLAWQEDPQAVLGNLGMGYKMPPFKVTHDMLRKMAEQDVVVAAVHETIIALTQNFMRLPRHEYDIGFEIVHKEKEKKDYTPQDKNRIKSYENWFLECGPDDDDLRRPNLRVFTRKVLDNLLTFDAATWEIMQKRDGTPYSFRHVPAESIFHAPPARSSGYVTPSEQRMRTAYVQVNHDVTVNAWREHQMVYSSLRPRTSMYGAGYGTPPLETLINTVTSHLLAEQWNTNIFRNGSTIPGILNFQGNPGRKKLNQFRRQWLATASGVSNAHKIIVTNTPGLEWQALNWSNSEMGFNEWIGYLIELICAIYKIPAEFVGFSLKRRAGRQDDSRKDNASSEEIQFAKAKFLRPMLYLLEDEFNSKKMLGKIDPRFKFRFYGIDPRDEQKDQKLKHENLQNSITLNEDREQRGKPPLPHGDIPLNPVYMGYLAQKEAAEQQAQQMEQDQAMQAHTSQGRAAPSNQEAIRNNADSTRDQHSFLDLNKSRVNRPIHIPYEGEVSWQDYDLSP